MGMIRKTHPSPIRPLHFCPSFTSPKSTTFWQFGVVRGSARHTAEAKTRRPTPKETMILRRFNLVSPSGSNPCTSCPQKTSDPMRKHTFSSSHYHIFPHESMYVSKNTCVIQSSLRESIQAPIQTFRHLLEAGVCRPQLRCGLWPNLSRPTAGNPNLPPVPRLCNPLVDAYFGAERKCVSAR